jgi:hypothetical protein
MERWITGVVEEREFSTPLLHHSLSAARVAQSSERDGSNIEDEVESFG